MTTGAEGLPLQGTCCWDCLGVGMGASLKGQCIENLSLLTALDSLLPGQLLHVMPIYVEL